MTTERLTTRLEIRSRNILADDGDCQTDVSVFCPVRERSVTTETCTSCPRMQGMERDAGIVVCDGKRTARTNPCDVVEAAARAPVGAFMRRTVAATRDDASIETLAQLFVGHGIDCVPVVDHAGSVAGVVTKSDLLRASSNKTALAGVARDIMTPGVYCLPEDARLAHAIALMAAEKIAHVPILGEDGALVGVVSEGDVIRWLAQQLGYGVDDRCVGQKSR